MSYYFQHSNYNCSAARHTAVEEVNDNRDLDYFEADDNLESAGGKILDHCCWKG